MARGLDDGLLRFCNGAWRDNDGDAVEIMEVVHGRWKPYHDYFTKRQVGWICSICSTVKDDVVNGDTYFCPECGAMMDGDEDD